MAKAARRADPYFESANPIIRVEDMDRALAFYTEVLGFENADWGTDTFTLLSRDDASFYLCCGDQGRGGAYFWLGVDDVRPLFEELRDRGIPILHPPVQYPWGLEMQVEDPDGNVLRISSAVEEDEE